MNVLGGFVAGAGVALALLWLTRDTFDRPALHRRNHRDRLVPTAVGVLLVVVALAVEATVLGAESLDLDLNPVTFGPRRMVILVATGLGLLGLLDDLAGDGESGGFTGHLRALLRGRLTTGSLKLFGGGAVAVVAVFSDRTDTFGRLLADAALVALSANLANLFDRRPGRAGKVSLLAFVVLVAATGAPAELFGVAVVAGAGAALLVPDLRERLMLGDVGANVLGGVLGAGVVIATAPATRNVCLIVVLVLNLLSERVSFSAVIERVAPLRALDDAGRVD